jgi:hypothetical protein
MTTLHEAQVELLANSVSAFSKASGAQICVEVEKNSVLLLRWVQYLTNYQLTGVADELLHATGPSVREVAASLSMGLIRPALFVLRSQIDLILTWLYFKDHRVEWDLVNSTGSGFKMKSDLIEYLVKHHVSYGLRFGILKQIAKRREEEPYRFLSAHIHGQSIAVLSETNDLCDLVRPISECNECVKAVFEVSEYLNDVLLTIYADNWASLPYEVRSSATGRFLTAEQRLSFFQAKKIVK